MVRVIIVIPRTNPPLNNNFSPTLTTQRTWRLLMIMEEGGEGFGLARVSEAGLAAASTDPSGG